MWRKKRAAPSWRSRKAKDMKETKAELPLTVDFQRCYMVAYATLWYLKYSDTIKKVKKIRAKLLSSDSYGCGYVTDPECTPCFCDWKNNVEYDVKWCRSCRIRYKLNNRIDKLKRLRQKYRMHMRSQLKPELTGAK